VLLVGLVFGAHQFGIPPGVPKDERLGRLKTIHGFAMEDVRRIVEARRATGAR
jgi:hypothetical protein